MTQRSRDDSPRPVGRKPVPFTERAPTATTPAPRSRSNARTRIASAQAATGSPRALMIAFAFGLPAVGLFAVSMLLNSDQYRLNEELFAQRLVRATILALAGGAAVAMFAAVFGRGGQALPWSIKIGALILATAALVLGILFGILL